MISTSTHAPSMKKNFFIRPSMRNPCSLVGINRSRIVAEYDQIDPVEIEVAPAIVERHRQRFRAVTMAAIIFTADLDAEVGGAMYAVDILNVQIADDRGFGAFADREHDPRLVLSDALALVHHVIEIDGPEHAIKAGGDNVICPTVHRPVIFGDKRTYSDFSADEHDNAFP